MQSFITALLFLALRTTATAGPTCSSVGGVALFYMQAQRLVPIIRDLAGLD